MDMSMVTVGLPVRNGAKTLRSAMMSIAQQTYLDWQMIVVDDGSTDESVTIAREIAHNDSRISVLVDGLSLGLPNRLNQMIDLCDSPLFARMDADDIAFPDRLKKQIAFLLDNPDVDLVGSSVIVFGEDGEAKGVRLFPEHHEEICSKPFRGFPIAHPTWTGRTGWFAHHRYREQTLRSQDQELLFRASHSSTFANLPEILLGYREKHLDARKILLGRRYFAQALFPALKRQGRLDLAMWVVIEQTLKGMVDGFAVVSGLDYRLLRHRAELVSIKEITTWEHLWRQLSTQDGNLEDIQP